jgi:MFS family permease
MVGTLPGRTQGLGLITEPLLADLQLSRIDYASINLWATLIGSLFCLPCGRLVDRAGSRVVLTGLAVALGLTVVAMGQLTGMIAVAAAITLTRGFGQSALSVVSLALVGKWFNDRISYAMGVYSLLVGIGFVTAFPLVGQSVLANGWRFTWTVVGWSLLLVLAPLAWLFVRNGLAPTLTTTDRTVEHQDSLTLAEALRSPSFWVFALASSLFGLVYSGISLFNQSILEQRGFDATVYHTVLVVSTLLGLAANFGGGWLAMRWPLQRLMGVGMAVLAGSLLLLPVVASYGQVMAYGLMMGVAGGVVTVVFFSVWRQVYGSEHLGRIQGAAQMMTVLASALGPLALAYSLDRTGSYDLIFRMLAVVVAVLGVACWRVPLPERAR